MTTVLSFDQRWSKEKWYSYILYNDIRKYYITTPYYINIYFKNTPYILLYKNTQREGFLIKIIYSQNK